MRRSVLGAALVAVSAALQLEAQSAAPTVIFMEKAYFSPLTPSDRNLLFEGNPSAHYFIFNQFDDAQWLKNGGWRFAMPISSLFVVRMTRTTSSPVLTPSYHIRPLYFQAVRLNRAAPNSSAFSLLGFATGWVHYSNGQRSCTYFGFERDTLQEDRPCVVVNAAVASQSIADTLDGDFSTSYTPFTFNFRRVRLIEPYNVMKWQWSVGVEFQMHPYGWGPGAPNIEQTREYGQHQASVSAELECRPKRKTGVYRLAADYTRRFGGQVVAPISRASVQASYVWDKLNHFGLFARSHVGYDYYNINFQKTKPFFAIGMMWDLGRLDSLSSNFSRRGDPPADPTVAVKGCNPFKFWKRETG